MREDEIIDISENEGPLGQETIEVDSNDNNEVDVMREHHIYTNIDEEVIEQMQEDIANNTDNIIQIGDLISGLQAEITSENKLESDLVDDTNQTNKFVTTQEKETWNDKLDESDLADYVKNTDYASSGKAGVIVSSGTYGTTVNQNNGILSAQEKSYANYNSMPSTGFVGKGTLENVIIGKQLINQTTLEESQAIQDEKITAIEKQIPTGEANDTSITLTDSADYWVKEFGIEGNTEQATSENSPSPEYPSPVNTITGDVEVKVQNKNLFDINKNVNTRYNGETGTRNTVSGNDLTSTSNGGSTHLYGQKIYVGKGNTVTFSAILKSITYDTTPTSTTTVAYLVLYNENSIIDKRAQSFNYGGIGTKKSVSITASTDYIYATFGRASNTTSATFTDIQVEYGTTAGDYIPHQEQNYPISLGDIELCKIGEYQDYIYKENGNWYKYAEIGKVVLDGSESWNNYRTDTSKFALGFSTSIKDSAIANIGLSNYFVHNDGAVYAASNNGFWITGGNRIYIGIDKTLLADISSDTAKKASFISWLSTHNTEVYYALATPTNTQITDTTLINQLNALEEAYTYKGVTHIDTDVETKPYLKVVYRKDIGLILERIENLEAKVSLLE